LRKFAEESENEKPNGERVLLFNCQFERLGRLALFKGEGEGEGCDSSK